MQTINPIKSNPLRDIPKNNNQVVKNKPSRILMIGSVLSMAVLMIGCSPTEATQSKTQNDAQKSAAPLQDIDLLNVSYDVSRDFYNEYNPSGQA